MSKLLNPILINDHFKLINSSKFHNFSIKLSYIKKITEFLGGKLRIDSKENVGTKITVSVPFVFDQSEKSMNDSYPNNHKKLKVLMVEDDLVTLKAQKSILNEILGNIDVAKSGSTAIKMAKKKLYNIIFIDINLPDIDGIEVTRLIQKIKNYKKHIFYSNYFISF